jgi:hypothetical protein
METIARTNADAAVDELVSGIRGALATVVTSLENGQGVTERLDA